MFTLFQLSKILLPQLADTELDLMLQNNFVEYRDYDIKSWLEVKKDDLKSQKVKINLVKTLYQSQFGYDGVYLEILYSLEIWSGTNLLFDDFSGEDNLFYQRFYSLLGFQNFPSIANSSQIFLLGSHCLPLAIIWGVDVRERIKESFARFCQVGIMQIDSNIFTATLTANKNPIAQKKTGEDITVSELIVEFFSISEKDRNQDEFIAGLSLVDSDVANAKVVLNLFDDLLTNKIWLELDHSLCAHKKIETKVLDFKTQYINLLKVEKDLAQWVSDYENVAPWLAQNDDQYVTDVFLVLKDRVDLKDQNVVQDLLNMTEELHKLGKKNLELIYFNESDGQFYWNEKIFS